jgi:hypothetical protein
MRLFPGLKHRFGSRQIGLSPHCREDIDREGKCRLLLLGRDQRFDPPQGLRPKNREILSLTAEVIVDTNIRHVNDYFR